MSVRLAVRFDAPAPATIELQGEALSAYYDYQADPSPENAEWFVDRLQEQCEGYTAMATTVADWKYDD